MLRWTSWSSLCNCEGLTTFDERFRVVSLEHLLDSMCAHGPKRHKFVIVEYAVSIRVDMCCEGLYQGPSSSRFVHLIDTDVALPY